MSKLKSLQRLLVVQSLYELTINVTRENDQVEDIFSDIIKESEYKYQIQKSNLNFAKKIFSGVKKNINNIEIILLKSIKNKNKVKSMDKLLLSIFQPAIYELVYYNKSSKKVIITEYLTIANRFFGEKETGLINGVLDNLQNSKTKINIA